MLYNVLPAQVQAFQVPVGLVGVLLSANRFVRLASNPLAAWAFRRFGLVKPLVASVVVAVATTAAYGVGQGFAVLLVARLLWGVCFSVLRLGGYLVVLEEGGEHSLGRLMGFFRGGWRAGSVIGVLAGGIMFDLTGRTTSFLAVAAVGLLGLPAALALGRRPQGSAAPVAVGQGGADPDGAAHQSQGQPQTGWGATDAPAPEMNVGSRRKLLVVNFTSFVLYFTIGGLVVTTLGLLLAQRLGPGATIAAAMGGIATLNGILLAVRHLADVAAPYLGHLGDRLGREQVLATSVAICLAATLLLAYPVVIGVTLAMVLVAFVATSAALTTLDAMAGRLAPVHRRAQVMSRYATWQDVGAAAGPLLGYALLSVMSLGMVYLGGAALLAAALASLVIVFRAHPFSQ